MIIIKIPVYHKAVQRILTTGMDKAGLLGSIKQVKCMLVLSDVRYIIKYGAPRAQQHGIITVHDHYDSI
jgi:hypothetical protein